jgi:hypothetical protein
MDDVRKHNKCSVIVNYLSGQTSKQFILVSHTLLIFIDI